MCSRHANGISLCNWFAMRARLAVGMDQLLHHSVLLGDPWDPVCAIK